MRNFIFSLKKLMYAPINISKKKEGMTRILFASDLHGSNICYKKFLSLCNNIDMEPDVLIIGGDITGKDLVYIAKENPNGKYLSTDRGKTITINTEAAAILHEKNVSDTGSYVYWCKLCEYEELSQNKGKQNETLKILIEKRVQEWMDLADQRLSNKRCKLILNAGNDDYFSIDPILQNSKKSIFAEGKTISINDEISIISCGYANQTPFGCPRDISEEDLLTKIEDYISNFISNGGDFKKCIFNFHCPPINSKLDIGPKLDSDRRPQISAFGKETASVGSFAVREIIEKYQPCLGLHGHIHESPGIDKINNTIIINPGSEYQSGILKFAVIDFENDKLHNYFLRTAI